jgi:hypothetical protein
MSLFPVFSYSVQKLSILLRHEYTDKAEADDGQPLNIDTKELADAAWFNRGELPNHPPALSIVGEMIEKFERGEL